MNGARELKGRNGAKARKSSMKKAILSIPDVFKVVSENLGGHWTKGMNWLIEQFTKKKHDVEKNSLDRLAEEQADQGRKKSFSGFGNGGDFYQSSSSLPTIPFLTASSILSITAFE